MYIYIKTNNNNASSHPVFRLLFGITRSTYEAPKEKSFCTHEIRSQTPKICARPIWRLVTLERAVFRSARALREGQLQWQGFVDITQSCSQGSPAVVTIIQHVLNTLKKQHQANLSRRTAKATLTRAGKSLTVIIEGNRPKTEV